MPIIEERFEYGGNLWLILLSSLFFLLMLGLGFWQLERGFDKREQLVSLRQENPIAMTNQDLIAAPAIDELWFQPIQLHGYWTPHSFLLDNSIYKEIQPVTADPSPYCFLFAACAPLTGRSLIGYRLFTLFAPRDTRMLVLIERGWLPSAAPVVASLPSSATTITGLLVPGAGKRRVLKREEILAAPEAQRAQLVQSLSPTQLAAAFNVELYAVPVILSRFSPGALDRFAPLANFSYLSPQRHWGYAVQWFLMALVLCALCVYASFRIKRSA